MKYDDFITIFKLEMKTKDENIEYKIIRQNQPESMADEDYRNLLLMMKYIFVLFITNT